MKFDLSAYLDRQRQSIDEALVQYIDHLCPSKLMHQPAHYAVMAGGKRLRPVLCLAACEAVGDRDQLVLATACALEMIHTYSLIHDDLPALDDDDMRRGKPTCHVQFDEATAVLAGDALLTMAFELLTEDGPSASDPNASLRLGIVHVIARAIGCQGMIEGQARDLAFEGQKLDQNGLEDLHRLKTGALIRAAIHVGAMLGQGSSQQIDHLKLYADHIGLAFQVTDDVLNVTGDPRLMGKAVGTDQARQKNTYPSLLGLDQSKKYAHTLVDDALKALSIFDNKADPLRAIAHYIVERNR